MSELLDKTRVGKWFASLDLKYGFNLIRLAAVHKWETAFRNENRLFEYKVMAFGLTNAAANFQKMMDTSYKHEVGCVWPINDTLVCVGETESEHQAYIEKILQQCINHRFPVNINKSEFHVPNTIFLVRIANGSQVQIDAVKIATIAKLPIPTKEKAVQALSGFANF